MPQMPKVYSPELIELIKAMLHQNPDKRPSVNRVLRDPYIKKNIAVMGGLRAAFAFGNAFVPAVGPELGILMGF